MQGAKFMFEPQDPSDPTMMRQALPSTTIDLQGVASFAAVVELLAKELGTTPGRMLGHLPNGPAFEELVGEIEMVAQGFQRKLTLLAKPGSPLTLRLQSSWNEGRGPDSVMSVTADFYLGASVEQVQPQGRALARHIEDLFAVLDRMVTLGFSGRLSSARVSAAQLHAFEKQEAGNLVRPSTPKSSGSPLS
jgi:hypothetical protein